MVHGTKVRLRSTKDGDGTVDREGGGNCRPMHVPSATGGNVTKRLEMFAVGDALAVAVGNGAPVGGAPTRVESDVRCCRSFAVAPGKPMKTLHCCFHW